MSGVAWLLVLGALLVVVGIALLRSAVDGWRRERRLQRRLGPFSTQARQAHTWHVVAPRPYDWQEDE